MTPTPPSGIPVAITAAVVFGGAAMAVRDTALATAARVQAVEARTAAWTLRHRALMAAPPSADTTYPSLALVLYQGVNPGAPGVQAVFSDLVIRDLP